MLAQLYILGAGLAWKEPTTLSKETCPAGKARTQRGKSQRADQVQLPSSSTINSTPGGQALWTQEAAGRDRGTSLVVL